MFYRDILICKQANKFNSVRTCEPETCVHMYEYVHKLNYEYMKYTVNEYSVLCLWRVRIMVYVIIQNYDFLFYSFISSHRGYICYSLNGYICRLFVKHDRHILLKNSLLFSKNNLAHPGNRCRKVLAHPNIRSFPHELQTIGHVLGWYLYPNSLLKENWIRCDVYWLLFQLCTAQVDFPNKLLSF